MEKISSLEFDRSVLLGKGRYGPVFKGTMEKKKSDKAFTVAVRRVEKIETIVDSHLLHKQLTKHPNVVRFFGTEESDIEFTYIVMELCAATLQDLVLGAYKGPKVGNHRQMLYQITLGVEFLHSKDIVHRDINPQNIYISIPNGSKPPTMKVGDFGMRRLVGQGRFSLHQVAGTKDFMAPEVRHSSAFTCAMDIYSLASSFSYTLTEKRINAIKKSRSYKAVYSILFELIRSMLNPDPKLRPSATQILKNAFFNPGRSSHNDISDSQASFSQSSQPVFSQVSGDVKTLQSNSIDSENEVEIVKSIVDSFCQIHQDNQTSTPTKNADVSQLTFHSPLAPPIVKPGPRKTVRFQDSSEDENMFPPQSPMVKKPRQDLLSQQSVIEDNEEHIFFSFFKHSDPKKERELLELCYNAVLEKDEMNRFCQLVEDTTVNINCKDHAGRTPLLLVSSKVKSESKTLFKCISALLRRPDVQVNATFDGWNCLFLILHYYSGTQVEEIVNMLIQAGIDLSFTIDSGDNILTFFYRTSKSTKFLNVTRALIERGIDLNHQNDNLDNALTLLCRWYSGDDFMEIARLLINSGINVQNENRHRDNALLILCRHFSGHSLLEVVRLLIESGTSLDTVGSYGYTALHSLCEQFHHRSFFDIVNLLIKKKINVKLLDNNQLSARQILKNSFPEDSPVMQLLLKHS